MYLVSSVTWTCNDIKTHLVNIYYKLEKVLGGISSLNRIPAALFIVDIKFEEIALKEARKLNLPIYTNYYLINLK